MISFMTWCLAIRPGVLSHTIVWRPCASTLLPQGLLCGTHRLKPSLIPTATQTASSSSWRPQLAIGKARSQSPLCGAIAARNLACSDGSTNEASTSVRSDSSPGLSQKLCFSGNKSGGKPAEVDQDDRYKARKLSDGQGNDARICIWRSRVLTAEARKVGSVARQPF